MVQMINRMKRAKSGMRTLPAFFIALAFFALLMGVFYIVNGQVMKRLPANQNVTGAQVWELTNDAGQTATVMVTPFTYSGTFSETSGSAGWYVTIPGVEPIRVPVSGRIGHASGGDLWDFTQSVEQGKIFIQGKAEGTSNAQFPYATSVKGTIKGVIDTPMGSQSVSGTWSGVRR